MSSPPFQADCTILRARAVLPVCSPIIEDGAVAVHGQEIVDVGRWQDLRPHHSGPVMDLGERLLLPGLINAHCHLDYTTMAGLIFPKTEFDTWIKAMLALKAHYSYSEYAHSWVEGAKMLLRHGVTAVADIEAVPELLPDLWNATPLRVISMFEMTGVKSGRLGAQILEDTAQRLAPLRHSRCSASLSPHAPYSTPPALLRETARWMAEHDLPVAIHLSESREEFEMYLRARGPLYDWLKPQKNVTDCGGRSPVEYVAASGLLSRNLIAVHVNYLAAGDAELLGRNGVTVAHCPRSHDYFNHCPFPYQELAAAGVNICLATDSLATVRKEEEKIELDLFAEMRQFAKNNQGVDPRKIIEMVTSHPARALRLDAGEIRRGTVADLIAIPFRANTAETCEAVIHHQGAVQFSMIAGRREFPAEE